MPVNAACYNVNGRGWRSREERLGAVGALMCSTGPRFLPVVRSQGEN